MGKDKALLSVDGLPLVERVCDAVVSAGIRSVFTVGLETISQAEGPPVGVTNVEDRWPGEGPLGGILSAMTHERGEVPVKGSLAIFPVDLPALTAEALGTFFEFCDPTRTSLALLGGRLALPSGVWALSDYAELVERFRAGERSVRKAIESIDYAKVAVGEEFADADDPKDFANFGYH